MPPTLSDRLEQILQAIHDIQSVMMGTTLEKFSADRFACMAIERAFEIISEASRRIPSDVKVREHEIDWQGMADLGNRPRHAYHRVDAILLWQIANRDLPPLKSFIERVQGATEKLP
jgi:uncharacterized protein with HEPN domain